MPGRPTARTLALNFRPPLPRSSPTWCRGRGRGWRGSRGPGAWTEGPWTAEAGRGRNLARWRRRRRQRQRRPLGKLGLRKRRQRRAGWGGVGLERRPAGLRPSGGRAEGRCGRWPARSGRGGSVLGLPPPHPQSCRRPAAAAPRAGNLLEARRCPTGGASQGGAGGSWEERRGEGDESGGWRGGDRRTERREGARARREGALD